MALDKQVTCLRDGLDHHYHHHELPMAHRSYKLHFIKKPEEFKIAYMALVAYSLGELLPEPPN
jgi:hypothetical protein